MHTKSGWRTVVSGLTLIAQIIENKFRSVETNKIYVRMYV